MQDFEKMYKRFNLEEGQISQLNKLASKQYPFYEGVGSVAIKTVVIDASEKNGVKEGGLDAKLV
ncbi:MAG: hypothetical protein RBR35_17010 [Salinivirgaceae bacterium]|nr:hypothetical protein [Salinivirgaceae bacterium]